VDVDNDLRLSNVDQSLKDKSLDAAMRDDTKRYALTVAIAKSVLARSASARYSNSRSDSYRGYLGWVSRRCEFDA